MDKLLPVICFVIALGISVALFPAGAGAVLLCAVCAAAAVLIIRQIGEEKDFLIQIFLVGLLLRVLLATAIYSFEWQKFFGPDSYGYDSMGSSLAGFWTDEMQTDQLGNALANRYSGSGWGMNYIVAGIYLLTGKNQLAVQFLSCVCGAATAPGIYVCARKLFNNIRVAKTSALIVAVFPSLILWSSQMLKDGFIIFLLVMVMVAVIQLQEKFNYPSLLTLIFSLFGIASLRFYIFYMLAAAVMGSLLVGLSGSGKSILRNSLILLVAGLTLTYLGVLRNATEQYDRYGSLERLQRSRSNLAEAGSGFGEEVDVSTTEGAISVIPLGLAYLMLAPFPWQISNFRQLLTIPEMLIWWASIPFLLSGLWYTLKNRLRGSIAVLIFTLMLTIAYSIFQGNVGTAYRQRAQIQVFLFMFTAVGWTLMREKRENRKLLKRFK